MKHITARLIKRGYKQTALALELREFKWQKENPLKRD